jgi:putative heme transporter
MSNDSSEVRAALDRWSLVRYVTGIAIGIVVLVVLFTQRGDLVSVWRQLARINWAWAVGAVAAESASLLSFSFLQRRVLVDAGAALGLASLMAISLANNAIALTVPGEPVVSGAFRFRQYRERGADDATSGWAILTIIIAQAIGLSLLLLIGVLVSLTTGSNSDLTGVTLFGFVIVLVAGAVLVRRHLLLQFIGSLVRVTQRITGHPRGNFAARVDATLERMREFELGVGETAGIVAVATLTWFLDFCCLLCAFATVHATIPRDGVLLAYGVAQIVAVLPIVPGGIGLVEGSLAVILVAYGAQRVPALSTVLVYRFVSYWLAVVVGWTTFGLIMFVARRKRREVREDPTSPTPLKGGDTSSLNGAS